jgi:predicted dehydrogenase
MVSSRRDGPLRAGMAACGGIADLTLNAATRSGEFEVVAIQDPDAAAFARVGDRAGIERRHADFEDLLTDDIDFVVLNGPNHVHLPQVRLAAAAKTPCLVQKPIAPTLADARALVEAARDIPLGVLMFELGKPLHHQVKAMVASGWLGTPTIIQAVSAHDIYLREPPAKDDWRRDPAKVGGGAFIQLAVHQVNLARWMLGMDVSAVTATGTTGRTVFEDETTLATARFGDGPIGHFAASYAASLYGFQICGTLGRIHLLPGHVVVQGEDTFEGRIFDYTEPGREQVFPMASLAEAIAAHEDAVEVHAAFARWLRGDGEFWSTGECALRDMEVVDAVARAKEKNTWITIR